MKKLLFIFNAKAGHTAQAFRAHLLDIISDFNSRDYAVTVMTTQHQGHASELIRDYAEDYDMLLCSGGDGTVNEVVNGVIALKNRLPIAYIPTGTCNDYAASLGIPKEIRRAIEKISEGNTFPVDVGRLNERAFVYVAALGTPVKVAYSTSQDEKNTWGYMAYVSELFKTLPETHAYHLRIECGDKTREGDYMFAFITNSTSVSGFKGITGKDVSLNDGMFEVTLVKKVANLVQLVIPMAELTSEHPDPRFIERFKTDHISISSDEDLEWCLDGEFGGKYRDAEISVIPKAVSFIV